MAKTINEVSELLRAADPADYESILRQVMEDGGFELEPIKPVKPAETENTNDPPCVVLADGRRLPVRLEQGLNRVIVVVGNNVGTLGIDRDGVYCFMCSKRCGLPVDDDGRIVDCTPRTPAPSIPDDLPERVAEKLVMYSQAPFASKVWIADSNLIGWFPHGDVLDCVRSARKAIALAIRQEMEVGHG